MKAFLLDWQPVFMLLYAGILAMDLILSALWNARYFRSGLPIFSRNLRVNLSQATTAHDMAVALNADRTLRPFCFHAISSFECAFRESFSARMTRRYIPIMHGVVAIRSGDATLTIVGRTDWMCAAVIGLFTLTAANGQADWTLTAAASIVLVVSGFIQTYHFGRIERRLECILR